MDGYFVGLELGRLSSNEAEFTIEQSIAALESTTTLYELSVDLEGYEPTPANNRRFIEPLCLCISNLRLHKAQHPLRKFQLNLLAFVRDELEDVLEKILVAAKQFGIFHMEINVYSLPVQVLVDFCRNNNSLKVLELDNVTFSSAVPLPPNDEPPNNSIMLTLDELSLQDLELDDSTAATIFENLVAHMNVSKLCLGKVTTSGSLWSEDDTPIIERILSELQIPSAEKLFLHLGCRMEHFKAALEAGTTTVTDLTVCIDFGEDDKTARLELLASFMRRAVKLNSLTILRFSSTGPQMSLPPQLFQALESCATVIEIEGFRYDDFFDREIEGIPGDDLSPDLSPDEVRQLQKITSRNRELYRFATNPGTYPTAELPELMRHFYNCPTGRYMLARCLPEVFSFVELHAMHLSRRRRKRKAPTELLAHPHSSTVLVSPDWNSACNIS